MNNFLKNNKSFILATFSDVEKDLNESDTGDLQTWPATIDGLTASSEFQDPDSALYKYVAYFDNSSKEVDHFLISYDQHTNNHHSTNKTLLWNDTRQTRKQAYNILICSDIVKNMGLKPKQESDAECVVTAAAPAPVEIPVQSNSSSSSSHNQVVVEEDPVCEVRSKIRGRKILLDFSQCPITPDTIYNHTGITFPANGIKKIKILRAFRNDPGPFLKEDITYIQFDSGRSISKSRRTAFNEYFGFLQRIMRHASSNFLIVGDLTSFPRFSSDIRENIDDIVSSFLLSERKIDGAKNVAGRIGAGNTKQGNRRSSSGSRRQSGNFEKKFNARGGGDISVANKAKQEFDSYGSYVETDTALKDRIQSEYWPASGESSDTDVTIVPWSAAFISFVTDGTGLGGSPAHKTYMEKAKQNRDRANGDATNLQTDRWIAFLPSEKTPAPGDIVCKPRNGSGDGWDMIGNENHCDIFSGGNSVIGGNLGHKIVRTSYNDSYTMIISKGATVTGIEQAVASADTESTEDSA